MKQGKHNRSYVFELDGFLHRHEDDRLIPLARLQDIQGDTWLVTDFGEAMSRFMSVDGPVKYAEVLARRKLQESGEFEESVEILTHWKRKRDKHTTDIFFTAVPTRLARIYADTLHTRPDHCLVFGMYSVLWRLVRKQGAKKPVAVVLRHDRFAEVLIGMHNRVYFANRCVAFDTQPEQIQSLWESIRTDIESVQRDQRIEVERIYSLGWIDACESPQWPEELLNRLVVLDSLELMLDDTPRIVSLPTAACALSAFQSISPTKEIALYYAGRWAPAANVAAAALLVLLISGSFYYWIHAKRLDESLAKLQQRISRVNQEMAKLPVVGPEVDDQLKFVKSLDAFHRQPPYREVINDLTDPALFMLQLRTLKVDYGGDAVRVELFGDIEAPFEEAHDRYKRFLQRLKDKGYRIEENRFETQISRSQIVLKLIRSAV